ncbi:hypothetical protein JL722_9845 [Aureococcus anophagefferens]|nr:hypothetical protein JL722_9845 [Aureococcus anophagefferens]
MYGLLRAPAAQPIRLHARGSPRDDNSTVVSGKSRRSSDSSFVEPPLPLPKLPKIKPPVRKHDDRAVKIEFGQLLATHGTYVLARRALRRAREEQIVNRAKRLEKEHRAQFAAAELATVVRLSTTTGTPTLTNPIEQQIARRKRMMPKPAPPPRPEPVNPRTKYPGSLEGDDADRVALRRMEVEKNQVAASIQRDFRRQAAVVEAFKAADDGDGKLSRAEFRNVLDLMGLAQGGKDSDIPNFKGSDLGRFPLASRAVGPYADDLGIPSLELAATREAEWWAASDCDRSGSITVTEALLVLPDAVCGARGGRRTRSEIVEYRETLEMEGEDFDAAELEPELDEYEACIEAALAWPTLQYKPFAVEHKQLAPPPPMWRRARATGEPCDAPPVVDDMAQREGYRSLETHGLICLGINLIQLPRNKIETLHSFGRTPQIGCRSLVQLVELRLPGNALQFLPEDIGLLQQLVILDLSRNSLHELPPSFLHLEGLVHLDLTHNNYKDLPDEFGALTSLETLSLADNILQTLPSTLPRLHDLVKLDLSGNGLTHLCIFPNLPEVARKKTSGEEDWDARVEPLSHKPDYCNLRTGKVQRTIPVALRLAKAENGGLELGRNSRRGKRRAPKPDPALRLHTAAYNHRKMELAGMWVNEWRVAWSDDANAMVYTSNVNGEDSLDFPASLDTLGRLRSLKELKLDRNQIRVLPPSLRELSNLEMMRVRDNYLRSLPDDLGSLSRLTRLDCTTNELSELPASTAKLANLEFLSLQSNRFERLPPLVGRLHGLRRLMLGNNSLTTLPYEVGFLTTLLELQVFNNPLIDPPYETISDLPMMMWSCRQKYWALVNGPLPVVEARRIGVADEVLEPEPAYQRRIADAVRDTQESRKLELQLQGVQEIPGAVRIRGKKGEPDVWMHPALESLEVLKLNMNHFKEKPLITPSLGNLRTLWLRACEIKELDDDIDHLQRLKELDLEDNRLTGLPRTFNRLRRLEVLNLAKNRLYVLPEKIGTLTALEKLDLAMNRLEYLPDSVTGLRMLKDLSVAVNNLYKLPVLSPGLSSLTSLNLDANELNLLPARLGELPLRILRASHNRLERLEADTFIGKASKTLKVLGVASNNLLELPSCLPTCEALTTVHVEYNPMRNPPAELLSEGMTILLQYCRLRDVRIESAHRLVVEEVNSNGDSRFRRFACGVLIEEDRPWGRKGEEVGCLALALDALVKDARPTKHRKKHRPPLFDVLKERLPPSLFEYTLEVLKDAIQKYQGPYGHVAQLDKVQFERCECVDDKGRTKGHRPCVLPAVVIVRVIYSAAEAQRRVQEDDMIRGAWAKVWTDVELKTKQRHGKLILGNEVHRRKRAMNSKIKKHKGNLEEARNEGKRLLEKYEIAKRRKINFENGDAFNFHRLDSAEEAEDLVLGAAEEVDAAKASAKECERLLATAKAQSKMPPKLQVQIAVQDLKRKYCIMRWNEIIDEQRWRSVDNDWRRPWDGKDGCNYRDFMTRYAEDARADRLRALPYNWEHTDDMSLYENAAYDTFEQDFVTEETSAQTRRVARNMRSLEKTGKVDDASFDPNEMKYCALLDALETGGAGSSDAGAAADAAGGAACDRVFLTDSDALIAPDAVDVGALLDVDGAAADLVLSAGADDATFPVDGAATLYEDFNSGAMIWTAKAAGLARQVVAFDNSNFKGAGACACDTRTDGCGDQWAFAGVVDARGFGGLRAVAYAHPAKLQRLFYHVDASADAYLDEYVAAGFPLTMVKATGEKMVEWPPASTDESFVMACAGADPLGCVETLHATFYGDAATPLTELADAGTVKGAYDAKFAADVLDAAYGSDIDCAVFDDDAWYPGAAYGSCFTLDINTQCAEHVWPGAPRYLEEYAAACATACPTEEAYASAPDGFVPSAYSDLCAWQGADYMAETRGGCGAHSFCLTCYDDDGSLNANCDRVLRHYAPYVDHDHPDDVHVSTTSVAMLFWADIDYWCARA